MPDQQMGQCKLCGMTAALNKYGYCKQCEKKIEESPLGRNTFQSSDIPGQSATPVQIPSGTVPIGYEERKTLDRLEHEECFLPTHKIIRAFNNFYKFFKRGSISASIVLFIGWLIYFTFGSADYQTQQYLTQSYARAFDPHWDFLGIIILILIFGLFFAYLSQAIAKIIEAITGKKLD